jgi:hypothetical protein
MGVLQPVASSRVSDVMSDEVGAHLGSISTLGSSLDGQAQMTHHRNVWALQRLQLVDRSCTTDGYSLVTDKKGYRWLQAPVGLRKPTPDI